MINATFTHLIVTEVPPPSPRVTRIWQVNSKYGGDVPLGFIKWFGRWRKYAFYPMPETIFEEVCMRELSDFIEAATQAHRQHNKKTKAASC